MASRFRRYPATPLPADAFKLLSRLADERGVELQREMESPNAKSVMESLLEHARTPIRLYGKRVEEMFAYVVVALGAAAAVKREETDDLVVPSTEDVTVPDYRVVLPDHGDILVEVKNINEKDPFKIRPLKLNYLRKLAAYGRLFGRPVYVAAYWSPWRTWTLHPVAELVEATGNGLLHFSFSEAYRRSHMRILGDAHIATKYPLTLRMGVTSKVLKKRGSGSEELIRIDSAALHVAGKPITSKRDEKIAFGFMFYGGWEESEHLTMDGDRVAAIEYSFSPIEPDSHQASAIVGSLSGFASSEFNQLTTIAGSIKRLRPSRLSSPPYPTVAEKYYGDDLPLWILVLQAAKGWHET